MRNSNCETCRFYDEHFNEYAQEDMQTCTNEDRVATVGHNDLSNEGEQCSYYSETLKSWVQGCHWEF